VTLQESLEFCRIDAVTSGAVLDGRDDELVRHLRTALEKVPAAVDRHRRLGIEPQMTRRTFSDLSVWCLHHRKRAGVLGITAEILDWSAHYLEGELLRVGTAQFEPSTRGVDLLEIHIPADTRLSVHDFFASAREAFVLFRRLKPGFDPKGIFGEAWLLDPQVLTFLPGHEELAKLQDVAILFPGSIPEQKTIRRLFGPRATRESVVALPREKLSGLQRSVADFLSNPAHTLRARGGLWMGEP
jgi:hypothetical protein